MQEIHRIRSPLHTGRSGSRRPLAARPASFRARYDHGSDSLLVSYRLKKPLRIGCGKARLIRPYNRLSFLSTACRRPAPERQAGFHDGRTDRLRYTGS
ncbi:hypothetical protein B8V81_0067 [Paenibacillus pasadenensis]|uniref:Uncharacterized protein n=1 Tax=Paenibacillus pasadenensis TaxID=217090 RepID=A0A2N5NC76_9BACL|nr:hypothetical protein B8V81_0067 [Paenibacillus pasadenensis]